ncbi:DUF5343 domain-containing protein [Bordetella genomosp. 6]|uniref:DUF5343 domain-containing protein n=1 Tax=Bordetella genomosp. 6 TaxID=463024 RepID=UPI0012FBC270|nr:DUF5343 domain-containing protein [Bordetella genomosp. 6]
MATLPYVTAVGNIEKALKGIKAAATPEAVSQDFVKTILGIKGGSGNQMTAYLKKIGFAAADGSPTALYKKFRNSATEGWAAAQALKVGYAPLYTRNEYMHKLADEEIKGLIFEETGAGQDSAAVPLILSCIKQLRKFAKWDQVATEDIIENSQIEPDPLSTSKPDLTTNLNPYAHGVGLNIGYTINLNLPATSDPAVFNAIFKALKEHLLRSSE